jgi:hypothetical protein
VTGRGLRGRRTAQVMLQVAIVIDALVAFLFIAGPQSIGAIQFGPPSILEWLVPVVGVALNLIGLVWMVRIYRADPEAHPSFWRFHRR